MSQHTFEVDNTLFTCDEISQATRSFDVQSIPRPYSVYWSDDVNPLEQINALLAQDPKNVLLIDTNVLELYRDKLHVSAKQICVSDATESFKTFDGVTKIIDFLYDNEITKSNMLVVVGGGITQDVGGFVAATYKRGLPWTFFPTTLLSMCDSCIGAKTGINYRQAKNQIALFSAPSRIVINPEFLKTLPTDAIQCGLGEILKLYSMAGEYYLEMYQRYVSHGEVQDWQHFKILILNALSIKKAIIEEDEFEANYRKSLNYGHTIGHSVESLSGYRIPHGQAVAIGMMLVNELCVQQGLLSEPVKDKLNALCLQLLTPAILDIMKNLSTDTLLDLLKNDKKVENNDVKFVMVTTPGVMKFVKLKLDQELLTNLKSIVTRTFNVAYAVA